MRAPRERLKTLAVAAIGVMLGAPAAAQLQPVVGPTECGLLTPGSDAATSHECLACHGSLSHSGHPYDLDLGRWTRTRRGSALRPINEVVRRGVFLPDGQIRCVTCHDGFSPWKFHIRLPPGSRPRPAVDLNRRVTYENRVSLHAPRPGDDVGRKPLCLACHALD